MVRPDFIWHLFSGVLSLALAISVPAAKSGAATDRCLRPDPGTIDAAVSLPSAITLIPKPFRMSGSHGEPQHPYSTEAPWGRYSSDSSITTPEPLTDLKSG